MAVLRTCEILFLCLVFPALVQSTNFKKLGDGRCTPEDKLASFKSSVSECADHCAAQTVCYGFDYHSDTKACALRTNDMGGPQNVIYTDPCYTQRSDQHCSEADGELIAEADGEVDAARFCWENHPWERSLDEAVGWESFCDVSKGEPSCLVSCRAACDAAIPDDASKKLDDCARSLCKQDCAMQFSLARWNHDDTQRNKQMTVAAAAVNLATGVFDFSKETPIGVISRLVFDSINAALGFNTDDWPALAQMLADHVNTMSTCFAAVAEDLEALSDRTDDLAKEISYVQIKEVVRQARDVASHAIKVKEATGDLSTQLQSGSLKVFEVRERWCARAHLIGGQPGDTSSVSHISDNLNQLLTQVHSAFESAVRDNEWMKTHQSVNARLVYFKALLDIRESYEQVAKIVSDVAVNFNDDMINGRIPSPYEECTKDLRVMVDGIVRNMKVDVPEMLAELRDAAHQVKSKAFELLNEDSYELSSKMCSQTNTPPCMELVGSRGSLADVTRLEGRNEYCSWQDWEYSEHVPNTGDGIVPEWPHSGLVPAWHYFYDLTKFSKDIEMLHTCDSLKNLRSSFSFGNGATCGADTKKTFTGRKEVEYVPFYWGRGFCRTTCDCMGGGGYGRTCTNQDYHTEWCYLSDATRLTCSGAVKSSNNVDYWSTTPC